MKVLIVPEDPILDQHILKPVVNRIFADLGRKARVEILTDPRLRGVDQALDPAMVARIVAENPMVELFLILVDRDGLAEKRPATVLAREMEHPNKLIACLAIEEIEVWMLAVHRSKLKVSWQSVRQHPHPKEAFAHPFLAQNTPPLSPGGGRGWAMRELGPNWRGVLAVCDEIETLKQRIDVWLQMKSARLKLQTKSARLNLF